MMLCSNCQKPVRPIVALDIDGTLADYHRHFLRFAYEWLGEPYGSKEMDYGGDVSLAEHLRVDKRTYRECKLAFRQGGMKRSMPIIAGARILADGLREAGSEVWLTTTRPYLRLDNIDIDTREWCRRNSIEFDGLLYDECKYAKLVEAVEQERIVAIVDDELGNCIDAAALGLLPIWMRTKYNRKQQGGLGYLELNRLLQVRAELHMLIDKWKVDNGNEGEV